MLNTGQFSVPREANLSDHLPTDLVGWERKESIEKILKNEYRNFVFEERRVTRTVHKKGRYVTECHPENDKERQIWKEAGKVTETIGFTYNVAFSSKTK